MARGDAFDDEPMVVRVNESVFAILKVLEIPRTVSELADDFEPRFAPDANSGQDAETVIRLVLADLVAREWVDEC